MHLTRGDPTLVAAGTFLSIVEQRVLRKWSVGGRPHSGSGAAPNPEARAGLPRGPKARVNQEP